MGSKAGIVRAATSEENYAIVSKYIRRRVSESSNVLRSWVFGEDRLEAVIYKFSEKITERFGKENPTLVEIYDAYPLSSTFLRKSHKAIATEVFHTGINWGRIMAFLTFSGLVAVRCLRNKFDQKIVDDVIEWTTEYFNEYLASWINEQGGWTALIQYSAF